MKYPVEHQISSLFPDVLRKHLNPVFIETGTNTGLGVAVARSCGFTEVHSVEFDQEFYAAACDLYKEDPCVHLYCGNSPVVLRKILATLDRPATFYLDAHSIEQNPLLDELRVIAAWPLAARSIILIDDVRMFGTPDWHGIQREDAMSIIKTISPDVLVAYYDTCHAPRDLMAVEFLV